MGLKAACEDLNPEFNFDLGGSLQQAQSPWDLGGEFACDRRQLRTSALLTRQSRPCLIRCLQTRASDCLHSPGSTPSAGLSSQVPAHQSGTSLDSKIRRVLHNKTNG